jgi:hypothetical protein
MLPLVKGGDRFVCLRAVDVIAMYGDMALSEDILTRLLSVIFDQISSPALVMRFKASLAFACLLNNESSIPKVKPHLPKILETYLQLVNKIDSESLLKCIEKIITNFEDEIEPFADRLMLNMAQLLAKYVTSEQEEDAEESVSEQGGNSASVVGCLSAMKNILLAQLSPGMLERTIPVVVDVFTYVGGHCPRVLDDALTLLNILLYKLPCLPPALLPLMQTLCSLNTNLFAAAAPEVQAQLTPCRLDMDLDVACAQLGCLRQYVAKLGEGMLTAKDCLDRTYLQLALSFAQ